MAAGGDSVGGAAPLASGAGRESSGQWPGTAEQTDREARRGRPDPEESAGRLVAPKTRRGKRESGGPAWAARGGGTDVGGRND